MAELEFAAFTLAVFFGILLAIIYSLRVLVALERRVASMEANIQRMTAKVLKEEGVIERKISKNRKRR
ncbi:hypothetical protein COV20_04970 [Candidatus Woesearchaeota archaeon CG10_big_fil_rev_8_21_14_0_10_45_16]|nr:MAG: hypothetical protein COV20_04970 [Candidatus Woesearchaeota archaeon CG10_big_fil_rev_8_21_14_0_10_45_16]